ncbi:MAG: hypothetical protein RL664_1467, partial [Bacteroidota bacterium]
ELLLLEKLNRFPTEGAKRTKTTAESGGKEEKCSWRKVRFIGENESDSNDCRGC